MKKIVLTLDYELYGNGSGDVFKHIIGPTKNLLRICSLHHAHMTIFFEVVEYWKLKEEWEHGNRMGYEKNPITAIEEQLQYAYLEGHDIQLHIHPQWVDAVWKDERWIVNNDEWRLGEFRNNSYDQLLELMKRGKQTIEEIIRPINANYECIILRAGGYNVQPSGNIIKAMKALGMKVDSSIVPGAVEKGILSQYDFSEVPIDIGMWECGNCLEEKGCNDIFEIPIVTFPIHRWRKYLSWGRIISLMQNRKSAKETFNAKTNISNENKSRLFVKIRFFLEKEYQTWDFCLFSKSLHRKYIKEISEQNNRDIICLVGHPKSLASTTSLNYLLEHLQGEYKTLTDIIHEIKQG